MVIVAGLLGIAYMSARVNDAPLFGKPGHAYFADFDNVIGIILKTPVMIAGIRTGYIGGIELKNGKARLKILGLPADLKIPEDSMLQIRDKGLLGERVIELTLGTDYTHIVADGGIIKNTLSKSQLDQIFGQFSEIGGLMPKFDRIASNIETMTNNLVEVLKQEVLSDTVPHILQNLKGITESVQGITDRLQRTIARNDQKIENVATYIEQFTKDLSRTSSENMKSFNQIVANFAEISQNLNDVVASSDQRINDSVQNVRTATEKLKDSLGSLKDIMEKIERGEGTVGKLLSDEGIANKLETTIDGVNTFIDTVNRIETHIGYRGEYLVTDSKQLQNLVQLKLSPRPDKYFFFEFVDEPFGDDIISENTITVDDGTPITTRTVSRDDRFTVSVEFAKRFYDLVFRFGIIRSEGGIGFDYYLLDDYVFLSVDAFDFGREERPHVRAYLNIDLWHNLVITAGADDLVRDGFFNTMPYDLFVGGGIHFTDEDLKAVLASVPLPGI